MNNSLFSQKPFRKRGGQPGNQNARKHGYYSRTLDAEQQAALALSNAEGLDRLSLPTPALGQDESVAPLVEKLRVERVKTATLIQRDPLNLRAIRDAGRLARLEAAIALLQRLANDDDFRQAFTETYAELGITVSLPPRRTGTNVHPVTPGFPPVSGTE